MESNIVKIVIKVKRHMPTIVFVLVWLVGILFFLSSKPVFTWLEYVFAGASIYAVLFLLWMLSGGVKLILSNEKLTVIKTIMSLPYFKNSYQLTKMEYIRKSLNEKANTYFSLGRTSPFKWYDRNPTVLYFIYCKSLVKIGEGLEAFDVDYIIGEIKKKTKTGREHYNPLDIDPIEPSTGR